MIYQLTLAACAAPRGYTPGTPAMMGDFWRWADCLAGGGGVYQWNPRAPVVNMLRAVAGDARVSAAWAMFLPDSALAITKQRW